MSHEAALLPLNLEAFLLWRKDRVDRGFIYAMAMQDLHWHTIGRQAFHSENDQIANTTRSMRLDL